MKSLKKVEGINVVPLIDIMLVLLAIVLTISSFIALGKIEMTLPNAQSSSQVETKTFQIAIDKDHQFFINEKPVNKDEISIHLDKMKSTDNVSIKADKLTTYEEFIFVVDLLKQKGIEKIGMVVQQ